jgi:hypothetical protein
LIGNERNATWRLTKVAYEVMHRERSC